jgi:hypothetical protein
MQRIKQQMMLSAKRKRRTKATIPSGLWKNVMSVHLMLASSTNGWISRFNFSVLKIKSGV